jgi:predicted nicotinamide N-methyase
VRQQLSLTILEASVEQQEVLVDAALESTAPVGGKDDDPYGVVLWPAAQVVANAIASLGEDLANVTLLELGAGTGLCSMAALACGADFALATDYREEPLELLLESAAQNAALLGSGRLETRLFDICDQSAALPGVASGFGSRGGYFLVAADLLYMKSTSVALARRCVEALRDGPACRGVLVGDLGRPGRAAFLEELVAQGVKPDRAEFEAVDGWLAPAMRHELISSRPSAAAGAEDGAAQRASVGLLRLASSDLRTSELT